MLISFIKRTLYRAKLRRLNTRIRRSKKYVEWRESIKKRDNYKCVLCNSTQRIEVDHITPFAYIVKKYEIKSLYDAYRCPVLWDTTNGRVLCKEHHMKTETYKNRRFL